MKIRQLVLFLFIPCVAFAYIVINEVSIDPNATVIGNTDVIINGEKHDNENNLSK